MKENKTKLEHYSIDSRYIKNMLKIKRFLKMSKNIFVT